MSSDDNEDLVKFRWIRIDKKTDIVALTAFLLALFATLFQVKDWLQGPEIEFYAPDRVVIYSYKQSNGIPIIRIAAPMSYTNAASSQYSAAVRSESVTMMVGSLISKQDWISFGRLARDITGFSPQITADASPVPIPGGSAVSHSTLFGPFEVDCSAPSAKNDCKPNENYISVGSLSVALGEAHEVKFEFLAKIYGFKALRQACSVNVTQAVIEQWAEGFWLIAPCNRITAPSVWNSLWKSGENQ